MGVAWIFLDRVRLELPALSSCLRLLFETRNPLLIGFIALLLGRRHIDFVRFVILDAKKLNDASNDARRIGGQFVIGHLKRRHLLGLEPSAPSRVLLLDIHEAVRDHFPIVRQNRFWSFLHPRGPGVRLQRLRHGHGLGNLVLATDIDIGRRRQHLEQRRILRHKSLEMMEMRLHSEDAIPRHAAREQLFDVVGR
jgi:hypothetical protein